MVAYIVFLLIGQVGISLVWILLLTALAIFFSNRWKTIMVMGMLSYGIVYVIYLINSIVILEIMFLINSNNYGKKNLYIHVIIGLLSAILSEKIFKIKKLRKGIEVVFKSNVGIGVFILGVILYMCTLIASYYNYITSLNIIITFIIFCTCIILFFGVWNRSISYYYNKQLRTVELDSYQHDLDERDLRIRFLTESNDGLARIVHRDNKLIPAMLSSVEEYLRCAADSPETLAERGEALCERLREMAEGRDGILKSYENSRDGAVHSGHAGVDAVITYMFDRAKEHGVRCEVRVDSGFAELIPERINEVDCAHLLSDLMDNARVATEHCDDRRMLVHLGVLSDFPVIEVSDSGVPFDPAVYQDFGVFKHSTHLGEGGSGIGLMDIWNLKKKYRASLHIYEYAPESGPYTKKLAVVFDGKNHYLIQTYRQSEVAAKKVRGDLFVVSVQ